MTRNRNRITSEKTTYCHLCKKKFHWLGINRHVAMHRDKKETVTVTFTYGDTYTYRFGKD